jgi:mannosyltransferase OCH1-like enzyme
MRYEILYRYGGIYVDTDCQALKNFDVFLDNESFAGYSYDTNEIGNEVLGTVPGNSFFRKLAESIIDNIAGRGYAEANRYPEKISGPDFTCSYLRNIKKYIQGNFSILSSGELLHI